MWFAVRERLLLNFSREHFNTFFECFFERYERDRRTVQTERDRIKLVFKKAEVKIIKKKKKKRMEESGAFGAATYLRDPNVRRAKLLITRAFCGLRKPQIRGRQNKHN